MPAYMTEGGGGSYALVLLDTEAGEERPSVPRRGEARPGRPAQLGLRDFTSPVSVPPISSDSFSASPVLAKNTLAQASTPRADLDV